MCTKTNVALLKQARHAQGLIESPLFSRQPQFKHSFKPVAAAATLYWSLSYGHYAYAP